MAGAANRRLRPAPAEQELNPALMLIWFCKRTASANWNAAN
jgi:hypothetical protein